MRYLLTILVLCLTLPAKADMRVPGSEAEISMGFVPVVQSAAPAVVNIYARRVVDVRSTFADAPFFQGLFRDSRTVLTEAQPGAGMYKRGSPSHARSTSYNAPQLGKRISQEKEKQRGLG